MTIRSYVSGKAPRFAESELAPIHLAEIDGRHYYAFAEKEAVPSGGKAANDALEIVYQHSQLLRQIKAEAARRILSIAPQWKQQNALADIYLLSKVENLSDAQAARLQKSEQLLQDIQAIRARSDVIEQSFLNGIAVEYLTDAAWQV